MPYFEKLAIAFLKEMGLEVQQILQASVDSQYERREHPAQPSPLRIQH